MAASSIGASENTVKEGDPGARGTIAWPKFDSSYEKRSSAADPPPPALVTPQAQIPPRLRHHLSVEHGSARVAADSHTESPDKRVIVRRSGYAADVFVWSSFLSRGVPIFLRPGLNVSTGRRLRGYGAHLINAFAEQKADNSMKLAVRATFSASGPTCCKSRCR